MNKNKAKTLKQTVPVIMNTSTATRLFITPNKDLLSDNCKVTKTAPLLIKPRSGHLLDKLNKYRSMFKFLSS